MVEARPTTEQRLDGFQRVPATMIPALAPGQPERVGDGHHGVDVDIIMTWPLRPSRVARRSSMYQLVGYLHTPPARFRLGQRLHVEHPGACRALRADASFAVGHRPGHDPVASSELSEERVSPCPACPVLSPSLPIGTTAVVYCEGQFGEQDGKTANGLVRHSEKYEILSVIDSRHAGADAGTFLDGGRTASRCSPTSREAIAHAGRVPDYLICGVAPADGLLSPDQRVVLLDGIARGMHIINGLHEFLNDDAEFVAAALLADVTITDVRRPKEKKDLQLFSGRIFDVTCPRIAVLGTDGAIGKRTTATLLVQALNDRGIKAVMVGTGQTTLIQGGKYGVALDALVPQFCSGEVEAQVVAAFEGEDPDVIVVEGQGALSHPAYLTSAHILRGSQPAGVIVQHAPKRQVLGDFPMVPMPTVASEVRLIEAFADTRVIGITDQPRAHDRRRGDQRRHRRRYELELGLPATDPLTRPLDRLVDMVLLAFPALEAAARPPAPVTRPALEVDLDAVEHNARTLVDRLAAAGHPGHRRHQGGARARRPSAAAMLRGGVSGLGDSRVENLAAAPGRGLVSRRSR